MDRFYNDDFDENDIYKSSSYNEDEEMEMDMEAMDYLGKEGIIQVINLDLAHKELRINLVAQACEIASKSFFWRFRSTEYRMSQIVVIFHQLKAMAEID